MYTKNQEEEWANFLEKKHKRFVSEAPFLISCLRKLSSRCLDDAIGLVDDDVDLTTSMREHLSDLLQEVSINDERIELIENLSIHKEDFMRRQKLIDDLVAK